jgi:hypothetical protein
VVEDAAMAEFEEEEKATEDQLADVMDTVMGTDAKAPATPCAQPPEKILVPFVHNVPFVL